MSRRLRIAILTRSFSYSGGAEKYVAEVTRRLVEKGHEIDVYAIEADSELLNGLTLHLVPERFRFSRVHKVVSFARNTSQMLSGRHYDVVHSHVRAYSQDVMTLHCFSYKGGVSSKHSAIRNIDKVYLSPRSWLYLWLERRQMQSPWLVSVSDAVRRETETLYERAKNIEVIPPGVDTFHFSPEWVDRERNDARKKLGLQEGEMAVLFVGTEFRRKGLDRLIRAIRPGMRLLVVGRGERLRYFRRLARQGGSSGRVQFEGWQEDVRSYYAAADVVALPSRSEAFGMSILEGMACGLPVVTSSNAGVSDLIEDGVNGFTTSEAPELIEVLSRLIDPTIRHRIGVRARKTAEEYTWDAAAHRHEELYYRVAADKGFRREPHERT
jgi:UDP-glucose:(heptosyl)LPS alpha-1,3-glucosyltransferase